MRKYKIQETIGKIIQLRYSDTDNANGYVLSVRAGEILHAAELYADEQLRVMSTLVCMGMGIRPQWCVYAHLDRGPLDQNMWFADYHSVWLHLQARHSAIVADREPHGPTQMFALWVLFGEVVMQLGHTDVHPLTNHQMRAHMYPNTWGAIQIIPGYMDLVTEILNSERESANAQFIVKSYVESLHTQTSTDVSYNALMALSKFHYSRGKSAITVKEWRGIVAPIREAILASGIDPRRFVTSWSRAQELPGEDGDAAAFDPEVAVDALLSVECATYCGFMSSYLFGDPRLPEGYQWAERDLLHWGVTDDLALAAILNSVK
jgi:hypothetical protein